MDLTQTLIEQVSDAAHRGQALALRGGNSKAFYGHACDGEPLELANHSGIVSYEPTELVLTARAGTPVQEIRELLTAHGQQLAFDPPHFAGQPTLGGAVAAGLAGPGRPWLGAPRDQVLGVRLLDGLGRDLRFGGQVMKNVAGYDVSRLMAGALGTLGVLLEVSVKVLPAPAQQCTQVLSLPREAAVQRMRELARQSAPLAGMLYHAEQLFIRLAGATSSLSAWQTRIGGEALADEASFWQQIRDHRHDFFQREAPLWRLSLAPDAPAQACETEVMLDWGGAQRWLYSDLPAAHIREQVQQFGGHACLFARAPAQADIFHPLPPLMQLLHRRLKQQFDPKGILNPGRLFHD